jgi:hypothetical protein
MESLLCLHIKIICAICNKFFRPLSSGAAEEDEIIAAKMKFLSKEINSLKSFVEENNLERKSAWIHRIYCLEDMCLLCILTRISPGSYL